MKKGYFAAYLGGAATMGIVLAKTTKMAKKYGQEIYPKKKISLDKVSNIANTVLDKIGNK